MYNENTRAEGRGERERERDAAERLSEESILFH